MIDDFNVCYHCRTFVYGKFCEHCHQPSLQTLCEFLLGWDWARFVELMFLMEDPCYFTQFASGGVYGPVEFSIRIAEVKMNGEINRIPIRQVSVTERKKDFDTHKCPHPLTTILGEREPQDVRVPADDLLGHAERSYRFNPVDPFHYPIDNPPVQNVVGFVNYYYNNRRPKSLITENIKQIDLPGWLSFVQRIQEGTLISLPINNLMASVNSF